MRRIFTTTMFGIICALFGLAAGVWFAPQLKLSPPFQMIASFAYKVPWSKSISQADSNSPFEMYDYPTIKWRPRPFADPDGAIAQLWTRYEWNDNTHSSGKMNYRLTVFKAPGKTQCTVQLLDDKGFKITQFDATDFHQVPGAPDIMEARDSFAVTEDQYKKVGDYAVN